MSDKYDDLEIHYLNVEADIPQRQFGVPTGQYLAWLIRRGWASADLNAFLDDLEACSTSGCDVLWDQCDGQLIADDQSDAGNQFTAAYFEQHYFTDYLALFGLDREKPDALYRPADTPENAARVARMLDARVRARSVTPGLPTLEAIHTLLTDTAQEHLAPRGFVSSDEMRWSERFRIATLTRPFAGGEHRLSLGTYLDSKRGHHGVFADLSSVHQHVAAALREAYTPAERAAMSAYAEQFIPVRLPMHAWAGPHPLLTDVQEGIDRFDWLGHRRQVVLISDADEVPHAIHTLMTLLDRDLLPMLPELETPAGIARLKCRTPLRSAPANFSEHDRAILVCAELAKLPNLPALCDEMLQWLQHGKPQLYLGDRLMLAFIQSVQARVRGA